MRSFQRLSIAGVGLACLCVQAAQSAPAYTVTEAHPELHSERPVDLDDKGRSAFNAKVGGLTTGVVCRDHCHKVPPLSDRDPPTTEVAAMNGKGQVVGSGHAVHAFDHAMLSDGQTTIDLGAFPEDGCGGCSLLSWASDVNDEGQVVGWSYTGDRKTGRAALWKDGKIHKLPTLGGAGSAAYAINNHGVIVGGAQTALSIDNIHSVVHAFLYHRGEMHDLGALPTGIYSVAFDVNDAGQVVGGSTINGLAVNRPFIYSDGAMKEIPTPHGTFWATARRLNEAGWVVGSYYPHNSKGTLHAFVFDGIATYDLNDVIPPEDQATWVIIDATAINAQGQILALAKRLTDKPRQRHALLLTPQP